MRHMDLAEFKSNNLRTDSSLPSGAEAAFLQNVPSEMREPVFVVWRKYADSEQWTSNIERLKAMKAFYFGLSILTRKD